MQLFCCPSLWNQLFEVNQESNNLLKRISTVEWNGWSTNYLQENTLQRKLFFRPENIYFFFFGTFKKRIYLKLVKNLYNALNSNISRFNWRLPRKVSYLNFVREFCSFSPPFYSRECVSLVWRINVRRHIRINKISVNLPEKCEHINICHY